MAYQMHFNLDKAELLQLKPYPFICMINFINKKLEIEKSKPTFIISVLKVESYTVNIYRSVLIDSIG